MQLKANIEQYNFSFDTINGCEIEIVHGDRIRTYGPRWSTLRGFSATIEMGKEEGQAWAEHIAKGGKLTVTIEPSMEQA